MRVELIELLRCPNAHEPSALITVAHARAGDHLTEGTLGCPVCGASYALAEGAVYFSPASRGARTGSEQHTEALADPTRLAALLDLSAPHRRVALCGSLGASARDIQRETEAFCIAVNAPAHETNDASREAVAGEIVHGVLLSEPMRADALLPLADHALHALAVDDAHAAFLAKALRSVRVGGRVLAPISAAMPRSCRELARDQWQWVAEVVTSVASAGDSAPLVSLSRSERA